MSEVKPDPRLARVLAIVNWKGGTGKTTLAANLSNTLARDGMRILSIDMDLSGNLALDFGLSDHPERDDGAGLEAAIRGEAGLRPVKGVRPGLDWVPGGMELRGVAKLEPAAAAASFAAQLASVAGEYDLVILDCPPNHPEIIELALGAARYILAPSKSDPAAWDGIRLLGPFVRRARVVNPALTWLGIALFDVDTQATAVLASTRSNLERFGIPVLRTHVRHSARGAHYTRVHGQLHAEFAARENATTLKDVLGALELRKKDPTVVIPTRSNGGAATSLQGDYDKLADELVDIIASHEARVVQR